MLCNIWSDGANVFLNNLLIVNIWVVGLSNLEELVREMELIMIIVIRVLDLINVRFVNLLGVSGTKFDNNRGLLRNRRVHTSTVDIDLGSTIDWSAKWRDSKG